MTIAELRKRSNTFVANLDNVIADIVEHNERLLQLNKGQMKQSKLATGERMVNSLTGSATYSPAYARRKGYVNPDLFVTGEFYREMDLLFNEPDSYDITSYADHTRYLIDMYSDEIFGIEDSKKAYAITTPMLTEAFKRQVL